MKKVFIDTNVIVDLLVQREGFVASAKVLASSRKADVLLYASVLTCYENRVYPPRLEALPDNLRGSILCGSRVDRISDGCNENNGQREFFQSLCPIRKISLSDLALPMPTCL